MWWILQFLGYLAVPYILNRIFSYLLRRNKPNQPQKAKQRTASERLVTFFLLSSLLFSVYIGFINPPENFFREIQVEPNSNFLTIKKGLQTYLNDKVNSQHPGYTADMLDYTKPYDGDNNEYKKLIRIFFLFQKKSFRSSYNIHGPSIIECDYCEAGSSSDYLIYSFPELAFHYLFAYLVLGVATQVPNKHRYRSLGALIIFIFLLCEAYIRFSEAILYEPNAFIDDKYSTFYDQLHHFRWVCIAASCLLLLFLDSPPADQWLFDSMDDSIAKLTTGLKNFQRVQLLRAAAFGNTELRKFYFEYHRQQEVMRESWLNDPLIKVQHEKVMQKYNIQNMEREAHEAISSLLADITSDIDSKKDK